MQGMFLRTGLSIITNHRQAWPRENWTHMERASTGGHLDGETRLPLPPAWLPVHWRVRGRPHSPADVLRSEEQLNPGREDSAMARALSDVPREDQPNTVLAAPVSTTLTFTVHTGAEAWIPPPVFHRGDVRWTDRRNQAANEAN